MPVLNDWEIGVMFWAGGDPRQTIDELKGLGVRCGQLGIPGEMNLGGASLQWKEAAAEAGFSIYTIFAAYSGESYTDIPTVRRTVGFVPRDTRQARENRTIEISRFAREVGVKSIATHIGCIPPDTRDPDYIAVRELVRRMCDEAARNGQTFALETGQETAEDLLNFLIDVNRENLGINFDPANMILYGTGDPMEALEVLGAHVLSVHCKDGNWPPKDPPGALGAEQPLGDGEVGMERFLVALKRIGYLGPLAIEREASDPERRLRDLASGVNLLRRLT